MKLEKGDYVVIINERANLVSNIYDKANLGEIGVIVSEPLSKNDIINESDKYITVKIDGKTCSLDGNGLEYAYSYWRDKDIEYCKKVLKWAETDSVRIIPAICKDLILLGYINKEV